MRIVMSDGNPNNIEFYDEKNKRLTDVHVISVDIHCESGKATATLVVEYPTLEMVIKNRDVKLIKQPIEFDPGNLSL